MTILHRAALAAVFCLGAGAASAETPDAAAAASSDASGRQAAQACRVCHGLDGVGTNPMIPNIGGQSHEYLSKQLQDFRAGRREDPQMSIIARDLSDEDIRHLSEWYASIVATYELPE